VESRFKDEGGARGGAKETGSSWRSVKGDPRSRVGKESGGNVN